LEELSNLRLSTPVVRIGWPDQFIEHGKIDALRTKYGITVDAAIEKLRPVLAATVSKEAGQRSAHV
jgi:1-deoxy-D-xylulose-5-phosphate synthase